MNNSDLTREVFMRVRGKHPGITADMVRDTLESTFDTFIERTTGGERITLFGYFSLVPWVGIHKRVTPNGKDVGAVKFFVSLRKGKKWKAAARRVREEMLHLIEVEGPNGQVCLRPQFKTGHGGRLPREDSVEPGKVPSLRIRDDGDSSRLSGAWLDAIRKAGA